MRLAHPRTWQAKVAALEYILHPHRGIRYADVVAADMTRAARREKIPVWVVATSAYVESELNMSSTGGIGMMQISPSTYREHHYRTHDLRAQHLADNLVIGASELSRHFQAASRRRGDIYGRLALTWGGYCGGGPHSHYVRRSLRVYHALCDEGPLSWQKHLEQRGPLWR